MIRINIKDKKYPSQPKIKRNCYKTDRNAVPDIFARACVHYMCALQHRCYETFWFFIVLPSSHIICSRPYNKQTDRHNSSNYYNTRKPVVSISLVVSFSWHQKISATTEHTTELNVKHVKHNVITTKSIKMALANLCTCRFV